MTASNALALDSDTNINTPTFVGVHFTGLTRSLSLYWQDKTLPKNIRFCGHFSSPGQFDAWKSSHDSPQHLPNHQACISFQKGKITLEIDIRKLDQIMTKLGSDNPQTINHFFELVPRVLIACFRAAREDWQAGLLKEGEFAASRLSNDPASLQRPRRIAALAGLDQENPKIIRKVFLALVLLGHTTLYFEKKMPKKMTKKQRKEFKPHAIVQGLVQMTPQVQTFKGEEIGQGERKGGQWKLAKIHPYLFKLFQTKFTQVPLSALDELTPRKFNVFLAALCQMACKGQDFVMMTTKRLLADAGLEKPHISGTAKEKELLQSALETLGELGQMTHLVVEGGKQVLLTLSPVDSKISQEATRSLESLPEKPPVDWNLAMDKMKDKRELRAFWLALVRTLVKSDRGETPPDTSWRESPKKEKLVAALE